MLKRRVLLALIISMISVFSTAEAKQEQRSVPPSGQIIYSHITGIGFPGRDTSGRYDLFMKRHPGDMKSKRITGMPMAHTKLGAAVRSPIFSPNGDKVLFMSNKPDDPIELDLVEDPHAPNIGIELWILSIASGKIRAVTADGGGYDHYTWSPDGKWIAAAEIGFPPRVKLYAWNLATNRRYKVLDVPRNGSIHDIFWSTDGRRILYQYPGNPNLYSVSRYGGKRIISVKGKGNRYRYSFSPDGKRIAFIQDNTVYMADADGSRASRIAMPSSKNKHPDWLRPIWSKDGRRLALAEVTHDRDRMHYATRIHDYDTTARRDKIAATLNENVTALTWSRDGKWLMSKILRSGDTKTPDSKTEWYTFYREGLMTVNVADGSKVTLKEPNEETRGLDWFELSGKGR